jgi:hypothetical protein
MSPQEAQAAIEADKKQRAESCSHAINAALREHGCQLVPVAVFRGGQLAQNVEIVAQ